MPGIYIYKFMYSRFKIYTKCLFGEISGEKRKKTVQKTHMKGKEQISGKIGQTSLGIFSSVA